MTPTPPHGPSVLALPPPDASAAFADACGRAGFKGQEVRSVSDLFEHLARRGWTATLLSLSHDMVDEALATRVADEPSSGALLLSAPGASLQRALLMERLGAVGLVREPWDPADLEARLQALVSEGAEVPLAPLSPSEGHEPQLIGDGPALGRVVETLARVAPTRATVLVTGESGTGKEMVARALHWASDRRSGPFVAVNCAAIPEHLLESELFGHEKGAFTGAVARRVGRFERADRGTLFLDEIGDMSPVLQAKILRVLEDRTVEPVGGESARTVDVRVVAATHRDLPALVADGTFREDLYHRLAVVELHLPPLRERPDDLRPLALHFAGDAAVRHGREVRAVTERALTRLRSHDWPGNVRELRNVIDRAVLLTRGPVLGTASLRLGAGSPRASARPSDTTRGGYPPTLSLEEVEADHIRRVLADNEGHMGQAADVLGIHRNTLTRKVREYGIEVDGPGGPA